MWAWHCPHRTQIGYVFTHHSSCIPRGCRTIGPAASQGGRQPSGRLVPRRRGSLRIAVAGPLGPSRRVHDTRPVMSTVGLSPVVGFLVACGGGISLTCCAVTQCLTGFVGINGRNNAQQLALNVEIVAFWCTEHHEIGCLVSIRQVGVVPVWGLDSSL